MSMNKQWINPLTSEYMSAYFLPYLIFSCVKWLKIICDDCNDDYKMGPTQTPIQ
jgi:hypothetical protein